MNKNGSGEGKLKEIAEHFGVNKATVSKALNGATDVSKLLREQICAYAESIGYVSKRASRKKGVIGILWCKEEKSDSAYYKATESFRKAAAEANYLTETFRLEQGADLNAFCEQHRLVGALLPNMKTRSLLYTQLKASRFPMVLLDSDEDFENPLVSSVKSNDLRAVSQAVNYLVENGHRLIAFLGGARDSLVAAERYAGYILGLARNGITYRYDLTYFGDFSRGSGEEAAEYFTRYNKYFTAIICASDSMAVGFQRQMARSEGRRAPEDYSIIGFDDLKSDERGAAELSTIRQDFEQIGAEAFRALKVTLESGAGQQLTVSCRQVMRGTTAPHIR